MKKDSITSVRFNSEILKALEKEGWTVQKLLDESISTKVDIQIKIIVKEGSADYDSRTILKKV